MKYTCQLLILATCALMLTFVTNVRAHHSYSPYDFSNKISLTGTITRFDFSAPHIWVDIEVLREDGSTEKWEILTTSPVRWNAAGHDRNFVKVDDKMTITGWPARNGSNEMVLSAFISEQKGELVIRATRGTNEEFRPKNLRRNRE